MPTVAELCALPYPGPMPFSLGLTAEDYRLRYAEHGETFRWWKATQDGQRRVTFSEQTIPATVLGMVWQSERPYEAQGGVYIESGATMFGVLRDEAELMPGDRIALSSAKRSRLCQDVLTRMGSTVQFPFWPVASVVSIKTTAGTSLVPGTDYTATDTGITFLTNTVAVGARFIANWRAYPLYKVGVEVKRDSPIGKDGELLPLRWHLTEVREANDA